MVVVAQYDGDVIVNGNMSMGSVTLPDGNVTDAMVSGSADILATKVRHQFPVMFKEDTGSDVTSKTAVIHIAKGDGDIATVEVVSETVPLTGTEQYTVDIQKGNAGGAYATILSSVVTIDKTNADRTIITATLSTTTYSDGDQFKVIITVSGSGGTHAKDLCVVLWLREKSG